MKPRLILAFIPLLLALMLACITVQTVATQPPAAPSVAQQEPGNIPLLPTTATPVALSTDNPQPTTTAIPISQPQVTQKDGAALNVELLPVPIFKPVFPPNAIPSMAIDSSGSVHFFWHPYMSSSGAFIYYTDYAGGGKWTPIAKVAETLGTSQMRFPPLVGTDGHIHLLWFNSLSMGGPYRLMYASFDGQAWSPEEEVYRSKANSGLSGRLFFDSQSTLHVLVTDSDMIADHYFDLARVNGVWSSPVEVKPDLGRYANWHVLPDQAGVIHFYGQDALTDNKLLFATSANPQVVTNHAVIAAHDFQTVLDNTDTLYYSWTGQVPVPGGNVTGLHFQCLDSSLNLWLEIIPTGLSGLASNVLVAQDEALQTLYAWETADGQIHLMQPHGCAQADMWTMPLPAPGKNTRELASLAVDASFKKACLFILLHPGNAHELFCVDLNQ